MLARRSSLKLRTGSSIDLPLLVPSFSSKGFLPSRETKVIRKKSVSRVTYPELEACLALSGTFLETSLLVSAYDIFHKFVPSSASLYKKPESVFIDSGGYELDSHFDETEPAAVPHIGDKYELENYVETLRAMPKDLPLIAASADWATKGQAINNQVKAAQALFADFPHLTRNFLLKPVGDDKILDIHQVLSHAKSFNAFDILGVTEKELGRTLFERLVNLATLRSGLDGQGIKLPIHVWGGLDPLISPLLFFAGAEIFDGVSWLRYIYVDGIAVCKHSFAALDGDMETTKNPDKLLAVMLAKNLSALGTLTNRLRQFVDLKASTFSMFERQSSTFERMYRAIGTSISELKGGH
jgi:hypothetical protein